MNFGDGKVKLTQCAFGRVKNSKTGKCETVEKFTWKTVNRLEVSVITFGASLIEVRAPNREGHSEDILLGYDSFGDYLTDAKNLFGSIVGPVSGFIEKGEFCIEGKLHFVSSKF